MPTRLKRQVKRVLRSALRRWAREQPRTGDEPTVHVLLLSAYGMGGTIRAGHNLAGYLAGHRRVEMLTIYRQREDPFFGELPAGVTVKTLDDRRPGAAPHGARRYLRRVLRRVPSVLCDPADLRANQFSLWTDVELVRRLRGRTGWLIATRPALNFMAAELPFPGLVTIGEEQMNLSKQSRALRQKMARVYPQLDALTVLTDSDVIGYRRLVGEDLRIARIPNTVRRMPGTPADLDEPTVLAAGRFVYQKGFDLLLEAWAQVAPAHPAWRLRLCGTGELKARYTEQIEALGLRDAVSLEAPADMGEAMSHASIFALSSRFEGFPLILLEAMSKAMGVVAFDCPTGPGEIVSDHENGILVAAKDVDGFAAGLRELIEDPHLRRRCAAAATETARRYTMESIGPLWDDLLDELWRARDGGGAVPGPARAAADGSEVARAAG